MNRVNILCRKFSLEHKMCTHATEIASDCKPLPVTVNVCSATAFYYVFGRGMQERFIQTIGETGVAQSGQSQPVEG